MADHYRVDPVDLEDAARRIEDVLARVARLAELVPDTAVGDRAWGVLGHHGRLHEQYDELLHATLAAVSHLGDFLNDGKLTLLRSAQEYADQERAAAHDLAAYQSRRLPS